MLKSINFLKTHTYESIASILEKLKKKNISFQKKMAKKRKKNSKILNI